MKTVKREAVETLVVTYPKTAELAQLQGYEQLIQTTNVLYAWDKQRYTVTLYLLNRAQKADADWLAEASEDYGFQVKRSVNVVPWEDFLQFLSEESLSIDDVNDEFESETDSSSEEVWSEYITKNFDCPVDILSLEVAPNHDPLSFSEFSQCVSMARQRIGASKLRRAVISGLNVQLQFGTVEIDGLSFDYTWEADVRSNEAPIESKYRQLEINGRMLTSYASLSEPEIRDIVRNADLPSPKLYDQISIVPKRKGGISLELMKKGKFVKKMAPPHGIPNSFPDIRTLFKLLDRGLTALMYH